MSNGCLGVGFAEPGEGCRATCGDFLAATDGDEEVVGELPDCVGHCGPDYHCADTVVFWTSWLGEFDVVDSREAGEKGFWGCEMYDAVERYGGHYVDE